jgi:hypothetical protein
LGDVGLGNGVPSAVGEGAIAVQSAAVASPDQIRWSAAKASGNQASPRRRSATCRRSGSVISRPTAQVQQHQRAMRGQPAQVTEVGRGLHGAAGNTDQRAILAGLVVGEPCAVGTIEDGHAEIICADIQG